MISSLIMKNAVIFDIKSPMPAKINRSGACWMICKSAKMPNGTLAGTVVFLPWTSNEQFVLAKPSFDADVGMLRNGTCRKNAIYLPQSISFIFPARHCSNNRFPSGKYFSITIHISWIKDLQLNTQTIDRLFWFLVDSLNKGLDILSNFLHTRIEHVVNHVWFQPFP